MNIKKMFFNVLLDFNSAIQRTSFLYKNIFLVCPIWLPVFLSFQLLNEPGLGVVINSGMALTPFPSSIG